MSGPDLPVHVEISGLEPRADVETFLLIHGYGGSLFTWRHWAPRLAARGHVVLMDMKGFGSAPKPVDGRYAPTHQADLVRLLIEEQDLRNLTLIGHSLGGGVALLAALGFQPQDPRRPKRLVLVAGAAYEQKLPPFARLADHPRLSTLLFRALGPALIVKAVLASIVHDPSRVDDDQVRGYAEPLGSSGAVRALIDSAKSIRPENLDALPEQYSQLDLPTLLLWGRQDRVVPLWVGERLARELPDGHLHVLEACGHLPPEEHPSDSYAVLEAFLDGTLGRA